MIPQQLSSTIDEKKQTVIKVLFDDTDVFVSLCSSFKKISCLLTKLEMDAFKDDGKLISINKSIAANGNVIPSLVALHALPGCNFMPMMFGLDKLKALKAVSKLPLR